MKRPSSSQVREEGGGKLMERLKSIYKKQRKIDKRDVNLDRVAKRSQHV